MQTPENSSYMYMAYGVVLLVYIGYIAVLYRRNVALRERIERLESR